MSFEYRLKKTDSKSKRYSLGLSVQNREPFAIKKERWYHHLLKRLRLTSDLSTGDEEIDRHLFFITQTPELLRQVIAQKDVLNAIDQLFSEYNFKSLYCFKGKLWGTYLLQYEEGEEPEHIGPRLEALETIATALNKEYTRPLPSTSMLCPARLAVLFLMTHAALFTLICIAGIPVFYETTVLLNPSKMMHYGFSIGTFFCILWFICIIITMAGSSWFPMVLVDFFLFGVAGILLSTLFILREINIEWDIRPATPFHQAILSKGCSLVCPSWSGKRRRTATYSLNASECSTAEKQNTLLKYGNIDYKCGSRAKFHYKISIEPWSPYQEGVFIFPTESTIFDQIKDGDLMTVESHQGALGFPWVDTSKIKPHSP
jgi:uncharacterized membrane protein